jgi:cell wall assembly regulator SMI1
MFLNGWNTFRRGQATRKLPRQSGFWECAFPRISANPYWEKYYALDLDPDEGGTMGQVITHDTHEDVHYVKARSFREWLEQYVTDLENGKYQVKRSACGIFLEER